MDTDNHCLCFDCDKTIFICHRLILTSPLWTIILTNTNLSAW